MPLFNADYSDILSVHESGVRLVARARPGLSRPRPMKIVDIGDGKRAVEITVSAAAEDGKANRAIIEALSDALGLKKADVSIKTGHTGRIKLIEIAGDAANLFAEITKWLNGI